MSQTYDLFDAFTEDELETVTNIFLEAFTRQNNTSPEVFELVTNIIID